MLAKNLSSELDDDGLLVGDSGRRFPGADDVDDSWIETDRKRFHFVQRPLVRLIVLTCGGEDRELCELTPKRGEPPHVYAGRVQSYRLDALNARLEGGSRFRVSGCTS